MGVCVYIYIYNLIYTWKYMTLIIYIYSIYIYTYVVPDCSMVHKKTSGIDGHVPSYHPASIPQHVHRPDKNSQAQEE